MNANSTFLVDKRAPGYSSKLERLEELLEELAAEEARKIVLFSEWTTMLTLIERRIARFKLDYVRLDGSVPQIYSAAMSPPFLPVHLHPGAFRRTRGLRSHPMARRMRASSPDSPLRATARPAQRFSLVRLDGRWRIKTPNVAPLA